MVRLTLLAIVMAGAGLDLFGSPDADLLRWGLAQGGCFLVLLLVLWSYRRDFQRILSRDEERLKVMTDIVQANTAAMVQTTAALNDQKDATHRLAKAVEKMDERLMFGGTAR